MDKGLTQAVPKDLKIAAANIDFEFFNPDYRLDYYQRCLTETFDQLGLGAPEFSNLDDQQLMSAVISGRCIASEHQSMSKKFEGTFSGSHCFELMMEVAESRHPEFCKTLREKLQGQTVIDLGFLPQYNTHIARLNDKYEIKQLVGVGYYMDYPPTLQNSVQGYSNVTAIDLEAVEFMAYSRHPASQLCLCSP
jgi:hypothetical protein